MLNGMMPNGMMPNGMECAGRALRKSHTLAGKAQPCQSSLKPKICRLGVAVNKRFRESSHSCLEARAYICLSAHCDLWVVCKVCCVLRSSGGKRENSAS